MAHYFKTQFDKTCVQVPLPEVQVSNDNIVCCVDISGSMAGSAMNNVNMVLKDIYERTHKNYRILAYNRSVIEYTLDSVATTPLKARGGTTFKVIFDKISQIIQADPVATTFIFMTDGEDTSGDRAALKQSITMLKMTMNAMATTPVTIHTIGFGSSVKADFLKEVRMFGTKEGLFKYSTESAELQNDFNDMFEYASSSREVDIVIGGKTYETEENSNTVRLLVTEDLAEGTDITVKVDGKTYTHSLSELKDVRSIHNVAALNLINPETEEGVRDVLRSLNSIPLKGKDMMERMEVEQMKSDISERMMEYLNLFTQIKGGSINESVKLKLNALHHKAKFDNLHRQKKLDLRMSKNVEYFKKTDIPGILKGFLNDVTSDAWTEINAIRNDWVCVYSKENLMEIMKKSPENILCLGVLVERDENAITNPEAGLKLVSLSSSLISFDSFMDAVTDSKEHTDQSVETFGESYCIVGAANEKINAVIPLYIHKEHMKRVRILEGIMLGHLYTQNSYGYDKRQEIGVIKLVYNIISTVDKTEWNTKMVNELMKVCEFFVEESEGFKSAYGSDTHSKFLDSFHDRSLVQVTDLTIPLMVGMIKNDAKKTALACYYEHIRRHHANLYSKTEANSVVQRLLYGVNEEKLVAGESTTVESKDLSYVETSYESFFHDEQIKPVPLVKERSTLSDRKILKHDADYLKTLVVPVPEFITKTLEWFGVEYDPATDLNLDIMRKELAATLHYNGKFTRHHTYSTLLTTIDGEFQGSVEDSIVYDSSPESVAAVVNVAKNTSSLECFSGILHKYAPKMFGVFFNAIVDELVQNKCTKAKEKLEALLSREVGYSTMYSHMGNHVWQPVMHLDKIYDIVGYDRMKEIEGMHQQMRPKVYWCYRYKELPDGSIYHLNNTHGHGNLNPCILHRIHFRAYNQPWSGNDFITT